VKSRLGLLLAGLSGFLLGGLVMYLLVERGPPAQRVVAPVASDLQPAAKKVTSLEKETVGESRQELPPASSPQAVAAARMVFGSATDEDGAAAPNIALALEYPDDLPSRANCDRDGAFVFNVRKPGRYELTTIECPGFVPASLSVEVRPEDSAVRADLKLKRAHAIPVRLLDSQGEAFWRSFKGALNLGPAIVVCTRGPLVAQGSEPNPALGNCGLASFHLLNAVPPAFNHGQGLGFIGVLEPHVDPPYVASIVCRSRVWASIQVNATPEELVFRVDLDSVSALGSIRARFRDEKSGKFLHELQIGTFLPGQGPSTTPLVADVQEYFTCARLPAGKLILLVSEPRFETLTLAVDVSAGACTDLGDISLRPEVDEGRRGVVLDESGRPVPDVEVRVERLDPSGRPVGSFYSTHTRSDGTFTFGAAASGSLLHLQDVEWVSAPLRCEYTAPADVPIELHASHGLSCRLAAGGTVQETWGVHLRDEFGLVAFEGRVRGGSEVMCKLAPGRYELFVLTPEGANPKQSLVLGAGGARVELPR
jgi:hypothetical protein